MITFKRGTKWTTIPLFVDEKSACPDWTVYHIVREFLQNAYDEHIRARIVDESGKILKPYVNFITKKDKAYVVICNWGKSLTIDDLKLFHSDKSGQLIGSFGTGLDLAIVKLLHLNEKAGIDLTVEKPKAYNCWIFFQDGTITLSKYVSLQNTISPAIKYTSDFTITDFIERYANIIIKHPVYGYPSTVSIIMIPIDELTDIKQEIREKILFVYDCPYERYVINKELQDKIGYILRRKDDKSYPKGKLFRKGIYVCDKETCYYSYDLTLSITTKNERGDFVLLENRNDVRWDRAVPIMLLTITTYLTDYNFVKNFVENFVDIYCAESPLPTGLVNTAKHKKLIEYSSTESVLKYSSIDVWWSEPCRKVLDWLRTNKDKVYETFLKVVKDLIKEILNREVEFKDIVVLTNPKYSNIALRYGYVVIDLPDWLKYLLTSYSATLREDKEIYFQGKDYKPHYAKLNEFEQKIKEACEEFIHDLTGCKLDIKVFSELETVVDSIKHEVNTVYGYTTGKPDEVYIHKCTLRCPYIAFSTTMHEYLHIPENECNNSRYREAVNMFSDIIQKEGCAPFKDTEISGGSDGTEEFEFQHFLFFANYLYRLTSPLSSIYYETHSLVKIIESHDPEYIKQIPNYKLPAPHPIFLAIPRRLNTISTVLEKCRDWYSQKINQLVQLQGELKEIKQLYEECEKRLKETQDKLDKVSEELNKCKSEKEECEKRIREKESEIYNLKEKIGALQNEIEQKKEEIEKLNKEIKNLKTDKEVLENRLDKCESEKSELKIKVEKLENDKKELQYELDKKTEELNRLSEELEALIKIRDELEERLHNCEIEVKTLREREEELQNRIKELESEKEELQNKITELERRNKELQRTVEELTKLKEDLEDRLNRLMEENKKLITENEELKKEIDRLKRENEELRRELASKG